MLVCSQISQTIENTWNEYVHHTITQAQKQCKKWPWPLSWLCKIVTTIIEWVETIVHVVIQVVVTTVCHFYQALAAIVEALIRLVFELWLRFIGLIDFVAALALILPLKNLRLHVVILRLSDGSLTASEDDVNLAIKRTVEIYRDRARIKVVPTVHVMHDSSPAYALQVKSGVGFFLDQASDAGAYFRQVMYTELTGLLPAFWYRIGTPIVAFVTQGVGDDTAVGCSSGPLGDYICVEGTSMTYDATTLAHEMGHACGLLHDEIWRDRTNLMYSDEPRGTNLSSLQRAIVRGSTHVTYF